jgi:NAD(P)-dependent dehydrogenase (short-subunit alcohol dehydrogenase family)
MRIWMVTGCSTGLGNALARRMAIAAAVQSGSPLRLPLGRDALAGIQAKADVLARLVRDAAPVALSTNF